MAKRNVTVKQKSGVAKSEKGNTQLQQNHIEIEEAFNPFPDPEDFEKLKNIDPSIVTDLIKYINKEQEFRHNQVDKKNNAIIEQSNTDNAMRKIGMIFAFIIFIVTIGLSAFLIYNDKYITGSIFMGLSMISVLGLFIRGQIIDNDK